MNTAGARGKGFRILGAAVLLFSVSAFSSGCTEAWKKKFIRKSKNPKTAQPILVLQPDYKAVMPAEDRYREHFAFWKSWHADLLDTMGQLKRRDVANLGGVVGELGAMQVLLTGEPAGRLRKIVQDLSRMKERWEAAPTAARSSGDRTTLQRVQREVSKGYHYSNIKETVVPEPEREAEEAR